MSTTIKPVKVNKFTYFINQEKCTFCGGCSSVCPVRAIIIHDHKSEITESCNSCGLCESFCPVSAICKQQ